MASSSSEFAGDATGGSQAGKTIALSSLFDMAVTNQDRPEPPAEKPLGRLNAIEDALGDWTRQGSKAQSPRSPSPSASSTGRRNRFHNSDLDQTMPRLQLALMQRDEGIGGNEEEEGEDDVFAFRRYVHEARYLSESSLYSEIELIEDTLKELSFNGQIQCQSLQNEVERLAAEIVQLRRECAAEARRARAACANAEAVKDRHMAELEAGRRRVQMVQKHLKTTEQYVEHSEKYQELVSTAEHEERELRRCLPEQETAWQDASEGLCLVAARVESLEEQRAHWQQVAENVKNATLGIAEPKLAVMTDQYGSSAAEVKALISERNALRTELREAEDAMDLKYLLEQERLSTASTDRQGRSMAVIQEMAQLEDVSDTLEASYKEVIEKLRGELQVGAMRHQELLDASKEADNWVRAIWDVQCQQKKEEFSLREKLMADDQWTEQLQKRVETLVQELRGLEDDAAYLGSGPAPLKEEEELEEDLMRALAVVRQQRRGAQHALASYFAKHKPLKQALDAALAEERALIQQINQAKRLVSEPLDFG